MKTLLFITLFIPAFSYGQKISIGIKGGVAISNAKIVQATSDGNTMRVKTSSRTGLLGGIYLDVPLAQKIVIRPGIEIVSKGLRKKDDYSNGNYPVLFTTLDFPLSILYKIRFTNGNMIAGGGPSVGIPINGYGMEYPLKIELGINGVIGYELAIGFSVNLNYCYGVSNASKDHADFKEISNRYFGISLGYSF